MVALLKRYRYCIIFLGILLFGLTSVLVFGDNRDDSYSKLNYDDWVLDWVENFDKQEIDTLIWSKIPRGKYAWNDMMSDDDRCFDLRNGCLKGGDLAAEFAGVNRPIIEVPVSDYFSESFFETKEVVYVPFVK